MGPPRYSPLCREDKALGITGHWSLTPPLVKWTVGLVGLILLVLVLVFGIKAFSPCPQKQCVGTSQPYAWSPTLVRPEPGASLADGRGWGWRSQRP